MDQSSYISKMLSIIKVIQRIILKILIAPISVFGSSDTNFSCSFTHSSNSLQISL
jgi:uncharacterized Fe-S cluster-containing radical SAM superfamily enzyme